MSNDLELQPFIDELLDSLATPEEVCATRPELLPEVRQHWQEMNRVRAQLDLLFPPATVTCPPGSPDEPPLPQIPGYEVRRVLGRGGAGIVYEAWQWRLNRPVALKMLLAGPYARPQESERFLREAEAVAGLRHPNVVQVHDVGDVDGRPYFTMEVVEGGSLARKLAGAPLPVRQAAALVAAVAAAVQAAHRSGIVHRDLKPANILLTADGTPKVTDFGLARRLESGGGLTLSGDAVGTPSYMAPEQARGDQGAIGPATDVYALGAILYECLTGRPPFRAESPVATLQQVADDEPVSPARLNPRVPRDLETICLKCLHKEPARRYASAQSLADDLSRFEHGESVAARPAGRLERLARWARRRPAHAVGLAASVALTIVLAGGGVWWHGQRTAAVAAAVAYAEVELRETEGLRTRYDFAGAEAALRRARVRLGEDGPADLHERLTQASRDLELVRRLDAIRLDRVDVRRQSVRLFAVEQQGDEMASGRKYEEAFREAEVGTVEEAPEAVAARVRASPVRLALAAALDDWAVCNVDGGLRAWVLTVARLADPDPWRDRVRDPATWDDRAVVQDLADRVPVAEQSPQLLVALGGRLRTLGGEATDFLRRVVLAHPNDFWVHVEMGSTLNKTARGEAIGHCRTALALRPGAAPVHHRLGTLLLEQYRVAEALGHLEQTVRLDPEAAFYHVSFGRALEQEGRRTEAVAHYREGLRLDPRWYTAHRDLGRALVVDGRIDEAVAAYRLYHPPGKAYRYPWCGALVGVGRGDEVRRAMEKDQATNPADPAGWYSYPELCLFLGEEEAYRRARRALLARFRDSTDPVVAARTSQACLLGPAAGEELRQAVALADSAMAARDPSATRGYPHRLFAKGLADYRQGRFKEAIAVMGEAAARVLGPSPRLVVALAQHRGGQTEQARKTLAAAVASYDWDAARADLLEDWVAHVLRREAEDLILPDLPAFLEGKGEPRDNDERLALLGACQFNNRPATSARLYAAAFAADPKLAEDSRRGLRYRAACAAARAGVGVGDGAKLGNDERARWREQARAWLRADLDALAKQLESASPARTEQIIRTLSRWRTDLDLAPLRDPDALEKLSPAEGREWRALWLNLDAQCRRAANLT